MPPDDVPDLSSEPAFGSPFDPLYAKPPRTNVSSAWYGHVPFAFWIVDALRPRCLVELGTHNGVSYSAFCEAVSRAGLGTRCFAVDTWAGDEHAGYYGDDVFDSLRAFHDPRYGTFSELLRATFDEALQYFADASIDLLHIDGCHTYEAVKQDFANWLPKLSPNAVVLLHDTNVRERHFGVWRFWAELMERFPGFEFIHEHGLGIIAIGAAPSSVVQALCHTTDEGVAARIRNRFASLGRACLAEAQAARLQEDIAEIKAEAAGVKAAVAELKAEAARLQALSVERQDRALVAARANQDAAAQAVMAAERDAVSLRRKLTSSRAWAAREHGLLRQQVQDAQRATDFVRGQSGRHVQARFLAQTRLHLMQRHMAALEATPGWPLLRLVNRADAALPIVRRAVRAAWWLATGQRARRRQAALALGAARQEERRNEAEQGAAVAATGLFDPDWYVDHYPDVAQTGLEPATHYALLGWAEGRQPGPGFDAEFYLATYADVAQAGENPLLHYARWGRSEARLPLPPKPPPRDLTLPDAARNSMQPDGSAAEEGGIPSARSVISARFAGLAPLPVIPDATAPATVVIITDSLEPRSLFGGVGTALILGTLMARQLGRQLRIVTRMASSDPSAYGDVLLANHIEYERNPEFIHAPLDGRRQVSLGPADIVLTTSWWTTRAVLGSVPAEQVIYLLQEDERMFYPQGDERLRCTEVLFDRRVRLLINTKELYDHLVTGPEPLPELERRATWFRPAFPSVPQPTWEKRGGKKRFFFYSRPTNERNLFWRGLEAVERAVEEGILQASDWDFYFVGGAVPPMRLTGEVEAINITQLPWSDYAAFIGEVDLGLSLMDTPHPSYPPLDLAAAGAVVVTSRHGPKITLAGWSPNIICVEPTVEGLTEGLRRAVQLAGDMVQRRANHALNDIGRDWQAAAGPGLDHVLAAHR